MMCGSSKGNPDKRRSTILVSLIVSASWFGCERDKSDISPEPVIDATAGSVFEVDAQFPTITDRDGDTQTEDAGSDAQDPSDATDYVDASEDAETDAEDESDAEEPTDSGPTEFEPGFAIIDDVRTNAVHLAFYNRGYDDLVITTIYFRLATSSSYNTIFAFGEFENQGNVTRCITLVDVARLGDVDILMVADSDPYESDITSVTVNCVPPGGRGVVRGIENEVEETLLEDATSFTYDISGLDRDFQPHPATPAILSMERLKNESDQQWLSGTILSTSRKIYNLAIDFYVKDERGLIVDDTSAFPLDLDTIPTNTIIEYESYEFWNHEGKISGLIPIISFIDGPAPPSASSPPEWFVSQQSPEAARIQKARRNREQYMMLRSQIEAQ